MKFGFLWSHVAAHKFCLYFAPATWSMPPKVNKNRGFRMITRPGLALCIALFLASSSVAEEYQLPPEVTPALRAACEGDVRRLCIGANPTVAKVKACVFSKFMQLGKRCQVQLALAGFKR
jgi:hypothetical protein